ncbi:MAG TPA: hypothetical protein VIO94_01795, partial [Phenylobacterium sp.]
MKSTATLLQAACAAAVLAGASPASAEWTRTYAVEWYEPAMYYGAKEGVIDPGTDCPAGSNAEPDWIKIMVAAGYTPEEAKWLRNPANPTRSAVHGQNQMAFRGKDRANVYVHPTSTPDPGLTPVTGKIAEGVDLDGDQKTGFISPTGERGIDNEFYRTLGCWKTYRGPPRKSSGALQFNDGMREGSWTVLIVVAGAGDDPMNDDDVSVGFYMGADKLVKDGNGDVARDYTFRIEPHRKFEGVLKGRVKAGRILTQATPEMWIRDPGYSRELQLLQAKADLTMQPDGSLKGYLGGYRPWETVYRGWVAARGPVIEALTWVQLPGVYYALKRNADYSPTGPGGEKTHISSALRIEAVPAFVMAPDGAQQIAQVRSYKAEAPTAVARIPEASFSVVDGIVVPKGQPAVSQTAEQLRP